MINRQATALTLSAISILFSSAAFADATETATADMHVSLTVEKSCQIRVGDMDFGSHPSDTGQLTVTSQANVTCTNGTEYQLSSASDHTYEMANDNGDTVAYTIYGDTSGSDLSKTPVDNIGTGSIQTIPIYGRVTADALAQAPAGNYSDTVTLTVAY